ncbi:MAG: rluC [Cytophagaceae bacterium]|jgi:23S rRNA pseudouridine955/2504/2580 synthase/23S rRNA pseudouridine1911/1915/1917 synthase|nr:rluC [Cytophagaceae bacterium]
MVEPDRNGYPNLLQQVKQYLKPSVTVGEEVYAQHIHRLDRPVRGIILFAKQRSVLKNLSEQFAERKVKKYYQALTDQAPSEREGILEHWLRKEKKKAVLHKEEFPYAEQVKLSYQAEQVSADRYLWNIELHTGKFHQIRAQLASVGCPIIGDLLYGSSIAYNPDSIALCACKLIFHHPVTNQELVIEINEKFNT